jgi:hypothetical protein
VEVLDQLQITESAMIGSLGNDSLTGVIPAYHRLQAAPESIQITPAQGLFELRPSAEAKEEDMVIAEGAAVSRLRRIKDGPGCWEEHRSSAGTGSGGLVPS